MMLHASARSYVCWRCAGGRLGQGALSPCLRPSPVARNASKISRHANSAPRRKLATVHHRQPSSAPEQEPDTEVRSINMPIREYLRQWEIENPLAGDMGATDFPDDGELSNNTTRPQNVGMAQIEVVDSTPLFVGDELVDLRSDDAALGPGDMVELQSASSRRPVLAICLGRINGYEHFYTISGKWFGAVSVKSLFIVKQFVSTEELEPLIEALPPTPTDSSELQLPQDLAEGPSRSAGSVLLRKMLSFAQQAETVYQNNAGILDASSSFVGHPTKHRYLTLHEIAETLFKNDSHPGDKLSTHSLYAVHRALLQDEAFFRPLRHIGHRSSYLFEVSPLSEVKLIKKIEKLVRDYLETMGGHEATELAGRSSVESFVSNAQKMIDESRKSREWSPYGIIGPFSNSVPPEPDWSATDLEILQFIELWASYQKFPRFSSLQAIGAALLRLVDRYQDARGYLPSTGWTFLQEIGWITPWEIPARYSIRFPDVEIKRGGSYLRPSMGMLDRHLKRDMLSLIRQPLNEVTAYCIDDITAREIDDAVSLERTSNPDEYWIHTHVADPASSFGADTPVAQYAELIPEAIYLPGHLESMLPESLIHDRFSLAPDRPCLTFSALVNTDGVVLNEKITANTLKKVIYMTYEDVASAISETRENPFPNSAKQSAFGPEPKIEPPHREMTRPDDLTDDQKSDLAVLSRLGKAIQAGRLEKGATPFFEPRPMAYVDFSGVNQKQLGNFISASGDPLIHVCYSKFSGTDLVENAMKLGNEVAARWCYERGIPIPYRTQPHALQNAAAVQQYARDVVNPLLNSGTRPSEEIWQRMRALVGTDSVSTTPGPHFTLGSDMYTKATSPLRRFGDLIVHWQIEAALLEEKKLGRQLNSSQGGKKITDDLSFLPFSRERLDRMLPTVRLCEKQARALTNIDGTDQWILQAMVRAWQFNEGTLPSTFKLTVSHRTNYRISGRLDWFDRSAILKLDALNNVVTSSNLRKGDVIEVRITDINTYSAQIFVEALRMVDRVADKSDVAEGALASRTVADGENTL
ncbi:hypothetical protein F4777DRAFT_60535 [Nemania sp. FL0916]|nr:hypothetical protein F4777DRAFT_60535 [Nemania sp. FL0916]